MGLRMRCVLDVVSVRVPESSLHWVVLHVETVVESYMRGALSLYIQGTKYNTEDVSTKVDDVDSFAEALFRSLCTGETLFFFS